MAIVFNAYLALGTAQPTAGVITEQTGAGYARQPTTLAYDSVANTVTVLAGGTFGPSTSGSWNASTQVAIFDASSAGNLLFYWGLASVVDTTTSTITVAAGTIIYLRPLILSSSATTASGTQVGNLNSPTGASVTNGVGLTVNAAGAVAAAGSSYSPLTQAPVQFRNVLDGGDFTVNPFQRNIPGLASGGVISTAISNTPTYFADRWFAVGGASSAILMASVANTTVPGFNTALQFGRQAANANTAAINLGQVMESVDAIRLQGQQVVLSFWAAAGANYSGGNLSASVVTGTGTNQSAAALAAGTWTGQATPIAGSAALTTTMTRYVFTGTIAANATQVGILLAYTPTGTAGTADNILFEGIQLEIGAVASPFEHRDIQIELEICQRYAWATAEPAAGVVVGAGMNTTSSVQIFYAATPVTMFKAPTVTVAAGSFKTNQAGTATAGTLAPGTTHTPNAISLASTSAGTAGQATLLMGGGGAGYILASADF